MPAIHVRNVPETLLMALRERAVRTGRSMQQEVLDILRAAAAEPVSGKPPAPLRLTTVKTAGKSTWSREELYSDDGR